jgi:hypothetical protein
MMCMMYMMFAVSLNNIEWNCSNIIAIMHNDLKQSDVMEKF